VLAAGLQRQFPPDRRFQVDLPLHLVVPARRVGILEIGHVAVRPRVEGVDDHLGIHRPGDLDPPPVQRLRDGCDLPVALAHRLRLFQEIRPLAGVETPGALSPRGQQLPPSRGEFTMKLRDQRQCIGRENRGEPGADGRLEFDAGRKFQIDAACSHGCLLNVGADERQCISAVGGHKGPLPAFSFYPRSGNLS
jgi:hypothetical protein